MTKPTGRPKGRPKEKYYVTLMARVPEELAERARRYARLKQQPISVVLRDGLELLLEEDRYRPFVPALDCDPVSDTKAEGENLSDAKRNAVEEIVSDTKADGAHRVSDRKEGQIAISGRTRSLSDTKAGDRMPAVPLREIVSDRNEGALDHPPAPPVPAILSDTNAPAFDTSKYTLGKLCPRGHAHGATGQSLLRIANRHCLACDREKFHERKAKRPRARIRV